jgi:hypothetical protein
MARYLTMGEIQLLRPVFGETLRYRSIVCAVNDSDVGGPANSITPTGVPQFSRFVFCRDFSMTHAANQWVFVHEMTHVWQWGHHIWPVNAAIGIFIQTGGDYTKGYPYDLTPASNLSDFNIEQQASLVADYWALSTKKLPPQQNKNPNATLGDYLTVIDQLQKSGPSVRKLDQVPL